MELRRPAAQTDYEMKTVRLLLALLILGGCSTRGPSGKPESNVTAQAADKRVEIDPALKGIIRVRQIVEMPSPQGFLQFQVDVENLGSTAITILYQVDWLDQEGASMGIVMAEPPCTLFRKEVHPIAITSPAAAARSFRLTLRPRVQ